MMTDGGQGLPGMDGASMGEQAPGRTVLLESQTSPHTDTAATTAQTTQQQYVMEEEIIVSVPLVRPKQDFLSILRQAGARGEVFTRKEICFFLKNYIGSRKLYDVNDPRVVHCKKDILGQVFGVENFTINDVLCLLSKNCTPVPDTCIKRKRHVVSKSISNSSHTPAVPDQKAVPTQTVCPVTTEVIKCASSEVITSTTASQSSRITCSSSHGNAISQSSVHQAKPTPGDKKRKLDSTSTDSTDGGPPVSKRKTSLNVTYSDTEASCYPWYFSVKMEKSDESEILSVQDKETMVVKDSTDDLWFVEEDAISVEYESDAFSVEYEVESSPSEAVSDTDENSDMSGNGFLVVCNDSDVPFWASSEMESESDSELSDGDKWTCGECREQNSPVQRYCSRCWKLRPDWLPEFHNQPRPMSCPPRKKLMRSHSAPCTLSSTESTASDVSTTNHTPVKIKHSPQKAKRLAAKMSKYQNTSSSSQPSSCSSSFLCNKTEEKQSLTPNQTCLSGTSETLPPEESEKNKMLLKQFLSSATSTADVKRFLFHDSGVSVGSGSPFPPSSQESVAMFLSSQESEQSHLEKQEKLTSVQTLEERTDRVMSFQNPSNDGSKSCVKRCNSIQNIMVESKVSLNPSFKASAQSETKHDDIISSTDCNKHSAVKTCAYSSPNKPTGQASASDMCMMCLSRPKTGSIIHGSSGHQVCCYQCAKRLKRKGKCCPVCRRSIQKVVRNFIL